MAQQITINVSDTIPPINQATIDGFNKLGNTYSKLQLDNKLKDAENAIVGVATQSNAPTPDVEFERWIVAYPITAPNSWGNLTVTQAELDENFVYFNVTNGVVSKELSKKPEGVNVSPEFDPTTETNAQGGKQIADWVNGKLSSQAPVYAEVTGYTWQNGYYVDLTGVVAGGGTNSLYRLSSLIPVTSGAVMRAYLRAGNLLAVSGWNNGVYASQLSIVGTDTNNGVDYNFTVPSGVTHIRLSSRVELMSARLSIYQNASNILITDVLNSKIEDINSRISNPDDNYFVKKSDFIGSSTITGNNTFFGGGKFEFASDLSFEEMDFVAKIKPTTSAIFGVCRSNTAGYGTAIVLNGSNFEVRKVNTGLGTTILTYPLGFTITVNNTYVVRMFKKAKDLFVSVVSEKGEYFFKKITYTTANDFGRSWGNPTVFSISGNIEILDAFIYRRKIEYLNVLHCGDSFVEGWGVIENLDKKYSSLFQKLMNNNYEISGRGGETSGGLNSKLNFELLSNKRCKYVILDIGTNDTDLNTFKANLTNLISQVKFKSKIPILATITPRTGYPIIDMNAYVRGRGELYIDKNLVVNNGTETAWNSVNVNADNVHPNVDGNLKIYNRMLFDLYTLYTTEDLSRM